MGRCRTSRYESGTEKVGYAGGLAYAGDYFGFGVVQGEGEDEGDEATGNKGVATGSKESGNEESLVLQWPSDVSVVPPLVNVTLSGAGQV